MNLKPFQVATVAHTLEQLMTPGSGRRFLVADETGLGKTLVAQGVIQGLHDRMGLKHLRVFYVCSSLSIAHQNRDNLLDMLPEAQRDAARVQVDRLTLLPSKPPPEAGPFTLYTLTPDTMPTQRSKGGDKRERALLAELISEMAPESPELKSVNQELRNGVLEKGWREARERKRWELNHGSSWGRRHLIRALRQHIARRLGMSERSHTQTVLRATTAKLQEDRLEGILLLRLALGSAAIQNLSPDLIIFDEFQRFFQMLEQADAEPEDEDNACTSSLMHQLLHASTVGACPPAVLLLSATPYRLYAGRGDGPGQHHAELFQLLGFLLNDRGGDILKMLKADFLEYGRRMKGDPVDSQMVLTVRDRIEHMLRRIMSRTERNALLPGLQAAVLPTRIQVSLEPHDIRLFRHLRDSLAPRHRGFIESVWSSIPYPMQMMDSSYTIHTAATLLPLVGEARNAEILESHVRKYQRLEKPHPKLRALAEELPDKLLCLPWLPPSRPWWPLGGIFRDAVKGKHAQARENGRTLSKVLIFSRYRAVPRSLASIFSYGAERRCYAKRAGSGQGTARRYDYHARTEPVEKTGNWKGLSRQPSPSFQFGEKKKGLSVVPMFCPLPFLASLGDPLETAATHDTSLSRIKAREIVIERLITLLGFTDNPTEDRVPSWQWAFRLEHEYGDWAAVEAGWTSWGDNEGQAQSASELPKKRRPLRKARETLEWALELGAQPIPRPPTRKELVTLAELAMSSPANVLWRVLSRVFGPADTVEDRVWAVTRVCMGPLRGYLDAPEFHSLLMRDTVKTYPQAVRTMIWDGNLESVLDEYLVTQRGLGLKTPPTGREKRALESLATALSIRTSSIDVQMLDDPGTQLKMRCHAVLPFGLSLKEVEAESTGKLRSDFLRVAFNSPFRPFGLVTTSIGQEGLDFHFYCSRLVHWDLPESPVDLEQRDGRIQRYGSLAVRRELAKQIVLEPGHSPWVRVGERQQESAGGLSPWWGMDGAEVERLVYLPHFSKQHQDFERLMSAQALYRMTLGQVDQEGLLKALDRRLEQAGDERERVMAWLRGASIRLAPFQSGEEPEGQLA